MNKDVNTNGTNPDVPVTDVEFEIKKDEVEEKEEEVIVEKNYIRDLLPYVIILIVVILVRTYIATPVRVDGPSMEPTLYTNNFLVLYKRGEIKRFSIVVLNTNEDRLVKRVIGLPGEKVEIINSRIYINDEEISDNYGDGETGDYGPIELIDEEYFVLGDNRENSTDSRIIGPINKKYIAGTATYRILPFNKIGRID